MTACATNERCTACTHAWCLVSTAVRGASKSMHPRQLTVGVETLNCLCSPSLAVLTLDPKHACMLSIPRSKPLYKRRFFSRRLCSVYFCRRLWLKLYLRRAVVLRSSQCRNREIDHFRIRLVGTRICYIGGLLVLYCVPKNGSPYDNGGRLILTAAVYIGVASPVISRRHYHQAVLVLQMCLQSLMLS